jgi:ribosome modulation factor
MSHPDLNANDPYDRGRRDQMNGRKLRDCPFLDWRNAQKWRLGWHYQREQAPSD